MSFDHICDGTYNCKCVTVTVVDDAPEAWPPVTRYTYDPEAFPEAVASNLAAAGVMTPMHKPMPWVGPQPKTLQPTTQYPITGRTGVMSPRNMFPTMTEVQDWNKTRDAIDWERRTGGITTKPELTAAYMDMASELYGLVAVIDVLATQIAQLQTNPRAASLGNGKPEKCYWCGNQRTSGAPCPHCARP